MRDSCRMRHNIRQHSCYRAPMSAPGIADGRFHTYHRRVSLVPDIDIAARKGTVQHAGQWVAIWTPPKLTCYDHTLRPLQSKGH